MSQWAIEEKKKQANQKRGKTWTSDWFITWDEFFFSTNHTPKYTKTEVLPDYFRRLNENYSMPVLIFERSRHVLVRICPSFNFANCESDFYFWRFSSAFFSTSTSSSKNFPKCTHLKGFYFPFLRNLKLFFTRLIFSPTWWGLLSVTLHNPSFLSSRPVLTNILDQWARENFYCYHKNVYKSRVNNSNISANWCQVDKECEKFDIGHS